MRELILWTIAHVDAITAATGDLPRACRDGMDWARRDRHSRLVHFWNSQNGYASFSRKTRVRDEQIHPLTLRTSRSFGRLKYFFEDCDLEAVVSQANRKQLRCTLHPDLNRLSTAGRLWCAYVAPRVSVDCYRPVAAAGRRAGCAGS